MIIDAQVHAYAADTPQRPWLRQPHNWPDHVTGDEMVAAMDSVGVDGAILVSVFAMYGYDSSYAVEAQRAHPDRFAIVKPVNPDDAALAESIAEWKKTPGAVAIRLMLNHEFGRGADDPGVDRVCREAARQDLPVNFIFWGNRAAATKVIDRHPDTRFAIDHLGLEQPRKPPVPADVWDALPEVLDLARRPNAVIKVSGACTMSRQGYPYPDIWDPLARVFDAWGMDRCMWGTDWTRAYPVAGEYKPTVDAFRLTDRLSESDRAKLMGGTCAKVYGWSPKGRAPAR